MISTVDGRCVLCEQRWPCDCRPCPAGFPGAEIGCDELIRAGADTHVGDHAAYITWPNTDEPEEKAQMTIEATEEIKVEITPKNQRPDRRATLADLRALVAEADTYDLPDSAAIISCDLSQAHRDVMVGSIRRTLILKVPVVKEPVPMARDR